MGTTGLESAFAVLYTELVLPGVITLATLLERLTAGARLLELPRPAIAVGRTREPLPDRPRDALADRRGGLREPLGQLLLRRPRGQRSHAADGRRRRRRLSRARLRPERRMSYVLLEDGTRFDGEGVGAPGSGHRRGRLQHRDVRLPGVDDRPLLRAPADHLHLPAHRQLRRLRARRWSPTASTRARAIMRDARNYADSASAEGGWLDWLRDAACPRSAASTRARSSATSATPARCAAGSSRRTAPSEAPPR